jgi:hypothetical protein
MGRGYQPGCRSDTATIRTASPAYARLRTQPGDTTVNLNNIQVETHRTLPGTTETNASRSKVHH